jgi:predicted transcriptional regulator
LDTLSAGFPATPTGIEIRILKKLFTPEEAELTMRLKNEPEEVSLIAARIGMEESELAAKLEEMVMKGLIFRVRDGGRTLYQSYQFMVGIYEFQLKNLDKEFCKLFEEYLPYLGISLASVKTKQLRVIPVESAVNTLNSVAPYNQIKDSVLLSCQYRLRSLPELWSLCRSMPGGRH